MNEAFLGALIGGGFGVATSFIGVWGGLRIARRNSLTELTKHSRELGMRYATLNYEAAWRAAIRACDNDGIEAHIPALKEYVLHGVKIMEIINTDGLSHAQVTRRIAAVDEVFVANAEKKPSDK